MSSILVICINLLINLGILAVLYYVFRLIMGTLPVLNTPTAYRILQAIFALLSLFAILGALGVLGGDVRLYRVR